MAYLAALVIFGVSKLIAATSSCYALWFIMSRGGALGRLRRVEVSGAGVESLLICGDLGGLVFDASLALGFLIVNLDLVAGICLWCSHQTV